MRAIESYCPKAILRSGRASRAEAGECLRTGTARLLGVLEAVAEETLRRPVAPGKWSLAQIADHLVLVNQLLASLIDRACLGKPAPVMAMGMLSDEGRPVAPEATLPRDGRLRAELLRDAADAERVLLDAVARAAEQGALDQACVCHGFFGELTTLECLQLAGWHVEHHLRQLPE